MRLFAAIDLSAEVVGNLEDLLRQLQPAAQINWSPPENLHITTKFIGEWPEDRLTELTEALGTLPSRGPFSIAVEVKLGFFPNPHAPRVFWAGVRGRGSHATCARYGNGARATRYRQRRSRIFSTSDPGANQDPRQADRLAACRCETAVTRLRQLCAVTPTLPKQNRSLLGCRIYQACRVSVREVVRRPYLRFQCGPISLRRCCVSCTWPLLQYFRP